MISRKVFDANLASFIRGQFNVRARKDAFHANLNEIHLFTELRRPIIYTFRAFHDYCSRKLILMCVF
jgi:hypothetical protein